MRQWHGHILKRHPESVALRYNLTGKNMTPVTTRMSSRGQVVVPERIRTELGLEPGAEFVVVAKGDALVFQRIGPPSWEQFDDLIREARRQARAAGLTRRHVKEATAKARGRR